MLMILVAMAMLTPGAAAAAAVAGDWYDACQVDQVGPGPSKDTHLFLTHTAPSPAWDGSKDFLVDAKRAKEIQAVALTAVVNVKKVRVFTDLSQATPVVTGIQLKKD
jgi:hypothetical protein